MIPRNPLVGTNSTTLGPEFADPADHVMAGTSNADDFLAALRQPWWHEAACQGVGVECFYSTRRSDVDQALQLCGRCASLEPCRAEAIADPRLDHGIRGGMDVAARRNSRRNNQRSTTKENS